MSSYEQPAQVVQLPNSLVADSGALPQSGPQMSTDSPLFELRAWRDLLAAFDSCKDRLSPEIHGDIEGKLSSFQQKLDDELTSMSALIRDLRNVEVKYQSMIQYAVVGIIEALPNGKLISVNLAAARMLGYASPEQLLHEVQDIGQQLYKDPAVRVESTRAIEEDGFLSNFKAEWKRRDGSYFWVEFSTRGIRDVSGQMVGYESTVQDITSREKAKEEMLRAYEETVEGWARALDLRDKETEGHTRRVMEEAVELAEAIGIGNEEIVHIKRGALLHDIGKMGIPDSILLKPGPLTEEEWTIMRKHPDYAYQVLSPIEYLRPALDIPLSHHERWDGTGYPQGLKGVQIPFAARIFAVVDVWDALLSDRPYRAGWPLSKVIAEIERGAGTHFDSSVVETFVSLLRKQAAQK